MNCPHCNHEIDDKAIARYLAGRGGRKSKRTINPDQQAKMQAARKAKRTPDNQSTEDGDQ